MKTVVWHINTYRDMKACESAVKLWRSDKGMTTVIVVPNKRVGYDAAGKFHKAEGHGSLTFLRFPRDSNAVMFKLGYVGVDDYVTGDV
jgi:hypothetical protein